MAGLDLAIKKVEIFALLGPSGDGKTTTIRMLTMLARSAGGTALINGYDVTRDLDKVKKEIEVVPQRMNLDQELTAWENLEMHRRLHRLPAPERRKRRLRPPL